MLYIPTSLMITPLNAFNDPVMGTIFREAQDVLRGGIRIEHLLTPQLGDFLLTMFLSYELSKGEESFWYPYLRILPMPGSISYWSSADLNELQVTNLSWLESLCLQDTRIAHRAMNKRATLEVNYSYFPLLFSFRQPTSQSCNRCNNAFLLILSPTMFSHTPDSISHIIRSR